jgi:hypothetical protein
MTEKKIVCCSLSFVFKGLNIKKETFVQKQHYMYVYAFLLTSMLCSVYYLPTGILRLP